VPLRDRREHAEAVAAYEQLIAHFGESQEPEIGGAWALRDLVRHEDTLKWLAEHGLPATAWLTERDYLVD